MNVMYVWMFIKSITLSINQFRQLSFTNFLIFYFTFTHKVVYLTSVKAGLGVDTLPRCVFSDRVSTN